MVKGIKEVGKEVLRGGSRWSTPSVRSRSPSSRLFLRGRQGVQSHGHRDEASDCTSWATMPVGQKCCWSKNAVPPPDADRLRPCHQWGKKLGSGPCALLVFVSSGAALVSCEYTDEEPTQMAAPPDIPGQPLLRRRRLTSIWLRCRRETRRNWICALALDLKGLYWAAQAGWEATGSGPRPIGIPKGSYTVTAACHGVMKASLTLSQSDRRGGTQQELALECGSSNEGGSGP